MVEEQDKKNNFSYYFKLFIKIIIFVLSVYYIYKYRETIRRYISILNRWLRFSSPLRNINARFRNFRERNLDAQRQPILEQAERDFQDNLQQDNLQENIPIAAAAAAGGYVRNRVREIDELESQPPRRSGRVANWTGPIREREYQERRANTIRENELDLQRKREEKELVIAKTGGYTIPYLKNWLTSQGINQPAGKDLQSYWDLVLGKTIPTSLFQPTQPSFIGETSSEPLQDINFLDNMYLPQNQASSNTFYPMQSPPGFLDQEFKPVDFGRSRSRSRNIKNTFRRKR